MWGQVQRGDVAAKVLEHFRGNIRGAWTRAPFVRVARGTLPRTGRAGGLSHTGLRNGYGGGLNKSGGALRTKVGGSASSDAWAGSVPSTTTCICSAGNAEIIQ